MRRKGWLVPILVFILSFSVLSFYQKFQNTVTLATTTEMAPILWSKTTSDINKVVYTVGSKKIETVRQNNDWFLSNFNNKQADTLYIYTVISDMLQPKFEKVIANNPDDLTAYGITSDAPTLSIFDGSGNEYSIVKGSNIDSSLSYVYVPVSKSVYSMKTKAFNNITIDVADWLNKQLLNFSTADVSKITFNYKTLNATLSPTTQNNVTTFSSSNLNSQLADQFVSFLQNSKIKQFITTEATDHVLQVYGFTNPSLGCTIFLNNGNTLSLDIGNIKKDENICYARVNNSNTIVAIPYFDFSQFDALFAQLQENNTLHLG